MYNHVTWPERFDPKKSAIYALDDIDVNAPIDGDETGSSAFHGWVMTPTENGCHVLSEETQQGPFFLEAGARVPERSTSITRNGSKDLRARRNGSR